MGERGNINTDYLWYQCTVYYMNRNVHNEYKTLLQQNRLKNTRTRKMSLYIITMPSKSTWEQKQRSRVLKLGTRWNCAVRFTIRPLYSQGRSPFDPLDRRLRCQKSLSWSSSSFYTKLTSNITDTNSKSTTLYPPIYA